MRIRYLSGSREEDDPGRREGVHKFPGRNRGRGNFRSHNPQCPQQHQQQQHNATNPDNRAETSRHSRVTSPEGWILVFSPPRLFTLKILAK